MKAPKTDNFRLDQGNGGLTVTFTPDGFRAGQSILPVRLIQGYSAAICSLSRPLRLARNRTLSGLARMAW